MRQTDQKSIAAIYHQKTKYYKAEMAEQQRPLNWSAQPSPFKPYHSEKKIDMMPYLPLRTNPFTGDPIEHISEEGGYPFSLAALSRLLYFTNGVTGILQYPSGESLAMRAAPTAGGLYPAEIYIAIRDCSILEDGIYNFQADEHSLTPVWEGNFWSEFQKYCFEDEAVAQSNLLLITTAVFQRSAWRYHERAYRRILLDTGHVLGNLLAYATEEGFVPYPIGNFIDNALNHLLLLEASKEAVLSVVALPRTSVYTNPRPIQRYQYQTEDNDDGQVDPLLLQLHRASSITQLGLEFPLEQKMPDAQSLEKKNTFKETIPLTDDTIDWHESIAQTILFRRSTRAYTGDAFSKEQLSALLAYAYPNPPLFPEPFFSTAILETYLIVQNIRGLESGVYYYAPQSHELRLIYAGDFKTQSWHFSLGQDLARDAAALVIHTAHLESAMDCYGDRAYRYLHLDAGHIGQRINLAAIRLKLGVSGIGGFYDDEVNALLGLPLEQIIVYITTLGQAHRNRRT